MENQLIIISYCEKHKQHWIQICPECRATSAEQDLLSVIRDEWAYTQAAGDNCMSIKLTKWIEICQSKGVTNKDWWELQE
uniref:Uncharacterized protein n=1 Tax=viral metagenome TaxID=1070528 RepID=A0A6M3LW92_9ZZZZ